MNFIPEVGIKGFIFFLILEKGIAKKLWSTIDSEKEALGRLLKKWAPSSEILIQTRPEGMCYGYDPNNKQMSDFQLLRNEVMRILKLMQLGTIDIKSGWQLEQVVPAAVNKSMGILTRELFMKGKLFAMGEEAGIHDRKWLAQIFMKWNLQNTSVSTAVIGVANVDQLESNLQILNNITISQEEQTIIDKIFETERYKEVSNTKKVGFLGEM